MKLFKKSHDGGANSGVTGYWLIEWKLLFSIVILRFSPGSRDAFHSHAFNALTWWIKGEVVEHFENDSMPLRWKPSLIPKYTPRSCFHKIIAKRTSWAISVRGPWTETWKERKHNQLYTLKNGRLIVNEETV